MTALAPRLSLVFAAAGHSYSHLFMLLYPTVVLALGPEFGRSYGSLLALATPGFIAYGAGALPAGWLSDRWSAFGMLVVFFIGTGAASIVTGFARTPFEIAAGLTLIGLFASIYHPVGTAWVVRHALKRGKALGVNGLFGNLGVAVAALIAGALTDLVSWRAAFIVPGVVCVLTGLAFLGFRRAGAVATQTGDRVVHARQTRDDTRRALVVLFFAAACGGLVFQATTVGLPKIFDDRLPTLASGTLGVGVMVSIVYGIAGFAQVIVGHIADRHALKPLYVLLYLLQAPLLFLAASLYDLTLLAVTVSFVFLNVGVLPVSDGLLAHYTPPRWRATVYGAKFVVGIGIAGLAVPLVAYIRDSTGDFTWLFVILGGLVLSVAAAGLFLPPERRSVPLAVPTGQAD